MRIDLSGTKSRFLLFVVVFSLAGTFGFSAGKVWLAEHWDSSSDPRLWQKAARLEPGNAWYWEHLGRYEQLDLMSERPEQATSYLERSATINSRSDRVWLELASVYEGEGDVVRAQKAYEKAKAAHPISSEVASRYGRFLLRREEFQSGFAEIRRAIETDPALTPSAVSECWKTDPNIEDILNIVLPEKSEFYDSAISVFLAEQQFEAAMAVWKRLLRLRQPVTMGEAIPLVNQLIGHDRAADAQRTWRETLRATKWAEGESVDASLVFNGGFENQPTNGGFDWREEKISGVTYALDRAVFHSGRQSMRVDFDGSGNFDFNGLLQYVAVKPAQTYHFSAYLRTEEITTESGIRFFINDPFHLGKIQVLTPNFTGSNPWTLVNAEVTASADTDFLVVALRRIQSWKFDNKLRGTVWVDDIALTPAAKTLKGSSR